MTRTRRTKRRKLAEVIVNLSTCGVDYTAEQLVELKWWSARQKIGSLAPGGGES
jgi:hypothetical protein